MHHFNSVLSMQITICNDTDGDHNNGMTMEWNDNESNDKQGEHIPLHCYISHNHPYISSSGTLGGTISISTANYVGMVV